MQISIYEKWLKESLETLEFIHHIATDTWGHLAPRDKWHLFIDRICQGPLHFFSVRQWRLFSFSIAIPVLKYPDTFVICCPPIINIGHVCAYIITLWNVVLDWQLAVLEIMYLGRLNWMECFLSDVQKKIYIFLGRNLDINAADIFA